MDDLKPRGKKSQKSKLIIKEMVRMTKAEILLLVKQCSKKRLGARQPNTSEHLKERTNLNYKNTTGY